MRLENKTAVITGGNSGIGFATAQLFVAEGARVAITGRNRDTLESAAAALGHDTVPIQLDVTEVEAIEHAMADAARALGKIDVVFANAGIAGPTPLGTTSVADFERLLRTNVTGVFFTVQGAVPYLVDGASVVLNGSVHAVMGAAGYAAYGASKAAVRAMTRNLASDLAPRRIRVNQVTPGATRTPIWSKYAPTDEAMTKLEERIARGIPLARLGDAGDVARAVLYLACDDSPYVTGTEIVVDGGATGAAHGSAALRAG